MNKIIIAGCTLLTAFAAVAMPNKKELAKAQRLVEDVTAADLKALKAGKMTAKEVANTHMQLAAKAASDAEKYLLLQGAFKLYARSGDYEAAAETLVMMNRDIDVIPPELMLELIDEEFHRGMGEKAPKVLQIYKTAKRTVKCRKDLVEVEKSLKAKPNDSSLNKTLAECCAELGNWPRARDAFRKAGGASAAAIAKETQSGVPLVEAADYWWNYQKAIGTTVYRQYAAGLYACALKDASFVGLLRTRAEQRVKEAETWGDALKFDQNTGLYCVIDISGGPKAEYYPVSYLNAIPKGGWSDEYKTTKLLLRKIAIQEFVMGDSTHKNAKRPPVKVKITKPYYMGVFEVTQRQWELVVGGRPAYWTNATCYATRPVENVSFDAIRGAIKGAEWPLSADVDQNSFVGMLRRKCGLQCDLPTSAQWECACRAGHDGDYCDGTVVGGSGRTDNLDKLGRYRDNGGWSATWGKFTFPEGNMKINRNCDAANATAKVGSYKPNDYGLYDMHGNAMEWCLDWRGINHGGDNPIGPIQGTQRIIRGGNYLNRAIECTNWVLDGRPSSHAWHFSGFRLAIQSAYELPKGMSVDVKTFDLKDGAKIEMIGCPACDKAVELGIADAAVLSGPFKFRITRPFWMMKANLSMQQLLACGVEKWLGNGQWAPALKAHPEIWDRYCGDITLNQVDAVCKILNSKYGDVIPAGYVFRLPTLAEWMYARQSGSRDMNDPYTNSQILPEEERKQYFPAVFTTHMNFGKAHGGLPGGMPSDRNHKNKWGFMDMWTFHTPLLDRVSDKDGDQVVTKKAPTSIDVISINYLQGNDPVSFVAVENCRRLNVSGSISGHDFLQISEPGQTAWGYRSARIVLGPDLEKEWNEKHKTRK